MSFAMITDPEAVIAAHLFHPLQIYGRSIYLVETSARYTSVRLPQIRDATGRPMVLHEELGVGSIVQIALAADGTMHAIKIVQPVWGDPFAGAED
jgi:hypothetical protein